VQYYEFNNETGEGDICEIRVKMAASDCPTDLVACRSLHLLVFWILFENVMSQHRTKATIIGLFDIGNVNEWIVTEKLGNLMKVRSAKYGKRYGVVFSIQRFASNMLAKGWKMSER